MNSKIKGTRHFLLEVTITFPRRKVFLSHCQDQQQLIFLFFGLYGPLPTLSSNPFKPPSKGPVPLQPHNCLHHTTIICVKTSSFLDIIYVTIWPWDKEQIISLIFWLFWVYRRPAHWLNVKTVERTHMEYKKTEGSRTGNISNPWPKPTTYRIASWGEGERPKISKASSK